MSTLNILFFLLAVNAAPLNSSEVGQDCGANFPDCPTLTCIPLSKNCTKWKDSWDKGCPGTCQAIDISKQHIYTLCGGWGLIDDCDERVESCVTDPRTQSCGPSCDDIGICWPYKDFCDADTGVKCPEGHACFRTGWGAYKSKEGTGWCFPLRYGSDLYPKTGLEEVWRTDQDGWQGEEK
ncbi:hypothetical protein QBC35DRAFT_550320 [Podospora australis]|uniref:Uncharacterized protein n=1 Tax=Podospora australis TaxID=1536484 RepID=A0AAN6WHP4_9PEZI|nr:hypothetical protein QBC35DRAFT_550320 [Podospora australis]